MKNLPSQKRGGELELTHGMDTMVSISLSVATTAMSMLRLEYRFASSIFRFVKDDLVGSQ